MIDHALPQENQPVEIHLIGSSHIDPVWLWPWTDGFSEVKATFQAALDRLDEYPGFIFTCAGAAYYQWIEENFPDMFERIRQAVRQGRWVPVNGWMIQPDCNIPCGESFARQGLYAQRYYLDRFGLICDTGYNVDSFGHNGMLPQILKLSGMHHYVFSRPSELEKPGVDNLFCWQSLDGSQVLAYRIPFSYNHEDPANLFDKVGKVAAIGQQHAIPMMLFYGVGNHGGGPTIALLDKIESLRVQHPELNLCYSSPSQYMRKAMAHAGRLQVVREDLQYHAIGCYSAMLKVKQLNRRAEQRLLAGERLDTLSHVLLGTKPQTARLQQAWHRVLFNQFHDILAGCSLPEAYDDAAESYGYALQTAAEIQNQAVQRIAWQIDTLGDDQLPRSKEADWKLWGLAGKGTPVVLFNPLSFPVTVPVEACGDLHAVVRPENRDEDPYDLVAVTDADGHPQAIQQVRSTITNGKTGRFNTLFMAELPALGYATYWLHKETRPGSPPVAPLAVSDDGTRLENRFVALRLSPDGSGISGLFDKQSGRERLNGLAAAGLVIDETHSDTWGHGLSEYRDVIGRFGQGRLTMLEQGPVRVAVRVTSFWGQSRLEQDVFLYADRPDIELRIRVFWQEHHRMLKLEFPLALENGKTCAEIPYGYIERPMDGKEKPIQQWVDAHDETGGVTLINDSTYACDVLDNTIRLTLLRGAAFADHYGERDGQSRYMEQGESSLRIAVCPHGSDWSPAWAVRKARQLNSHFPLVYETYHKGPLAQSGSSLDIGSEQVVMTVLKRAEDGSGLVLRCAECAGTATDASLRLPQMERQWTAAFGPCQIRTFLIPDDPALPVLDLDLLERAQ